MRKYSLKEIDRMRNILMLLRTCEVYYDGSSHRSWPNKETQQMIEEKLRTYLIADISPKEIEREWKKFLKNAHKFNCHEFDDDALLSN